jgi:hypothetical protein
MCLFLTILLGLRDPPGNYHPTVDEINAGVPTGLNDVIKAGELTGSNGPMSAPFLGDVADGIPDAQSYFPFSPVLSDHIARFRRVAKQKVENIAIPTSDHQVEPQDEELPIVSPKKKQKVTDMKPMDEDDSSL